MVVGNYSGLAAIFEHDFADAFADAVAAAGDGVEEMFVEFASIIERGVAPGQFTAAHRGVAELAQQSVLRSYAATVTGRKQAAGRNPYRANAGGKMKRYAGGQLRAALADPAHIEVSPSLLSFMDVGILDARAKHWARLNAGALGKGKGSRRRFEMRWGDLTIAAIGVEMSPSAPFTVPRGYWWDGAKGQPVGPHEQAHGDSEFHPMGSGPRKRARSYLQGRTADDAVRRVPLQRAKLSAGIEARNFLDAGVATIARELPKSYDRLYERLFETAIAKVQPPPPDSRPRSRPRAFRTFGSFV